LRILFGWHEIIGRREIEKEAVMIIDSHVHLLGEGWVHHDFLLGSAKMVTAMSTKTTGDYMDPEEVVRNVAPALYDTTGEKLIPQMDAAGVDVSCVFTVDYELATGPPGVSIWEQNLAVADACRRYPDRLVSFFAVDPRRENAVEMFSRAIEEWGMKGLKFHPTSGYYPYEEFCYPLYQKCVDYGVPVIIHAGSQPAPLKFRYTRPIYIDDVAADFPDLKIIMAHVGHQLWEEALLVASVKTNVFFDFSGWQITYNSHPADFYRMLRRILDDVGPWRISFGTDGPYLNLLCPLDAWVKAVLEPDLSTCPEISFERGELDIIMGTSFARLVGLGE
jgi:uncharacterized protein